MPEIQPFDKVRVVHESLSELTDKNSALHPIVHVLYLIAHEGVGLGEVLQDSAAQGHRQLQQFLHAASSLAEGVDSSEDRETLEAAHFTFKTVKSVLEIAPASMRRNKSELLGEKEKLSSSDITRLAHKFLSHPDVMRILASEDTGWMLIPPRTIPTVTDGSLQERSAATGH